MQIATELVSLPGILILDEPTKGLEPALRGEIFRILKSVALRGACVLVVTHAKEDISRFFDRELIIENRRVVEDRNLGNLEVNLRPANSCERVEDAKAQTFRKRSQNRGQLKALLQREFSLIQSAWASVLLVGCLVLPLVFALSISKADVSDDHLRMAGFLHSFGLYLDGS